MAEKIQDSFDQLQLQEAKNAGGFLVASMNDTLEKAKKLPPLVPLYDNIVLEGDLSVIFGQSGIGKTIFAMQVASDIAAKGKRVLYVDFEMTERQLYARYQSIVFPDTFFRAEVDKDHVNDDVLKGIEEVAKANMAQVVFIDNITALSQSLDKGSDAGVLMAELNRMKKENGWTMIILTHVPKQYSGNTPLILSAIQGSAKINQLVDDVIGLAQSCKDKSLVYVKQCKWRNGERELDADHVAVYERCKDEGGNLCFQFRGQGKESEHLAAATANEKEAKIARVKELHEQGKSQTDIARELGISQPTVWRIIQSFSPKPSE